jgi:hypothetical protein
VLRRIFIAATFWYKRSHCVNLFGKNIHVARYWTIIPGHTRGDFMRRDTLPPTIRFNMMSSVNQTFK